MDGFGARRLAGLPWVSWGTALLAAWALKRHYSRAGAEDLGWILEPTARVVGWLRGETLTFRPGAGWTAADGSWVIEPACAGVNFLILVAIVAVLGFAHRLRSPGKRLRRISWWLGAFAGAYLLSLAVNALRILAAVELYRRDLGPWLTPDQAHRLLGTVLYLGALWAVYAVLDRLTARDRPSRSLAAALLVPGAFLGMTLVVPLLTGNWRAAGGLYAEHAMMVTLVTLLAILTVWLARRVAVKRRA
jgi:exosortase K